MVKLLALVLIFSCWQSCLAHGRMEMPPARNAMWRHGFNAPPNYNDCELNCGGFGQQHLTYGGQCGVCGDSMHGVREHEVGGKYATGQIVKYYSVGDVIDINILLTANHIGYMEFKLCPVNDPKIEATHECLNRNVLDIVGHGKKYKVRGDDRDVSLKVKLPDGLSCSQCVLQWRYRAGNNWGSEDGCIGLGCGAQEEFYNCADIAIGKSESTTTTSVVTTPKVSKTHTTTAPIVETASSATTAPPASSTTMKLLTLTSFDYRDPRYILCEVADGFKKFEGMLDYCIKICTDRDRECPTKFCKCHGINTWLG